MILTKTKTLIILKEDRNPPKHLLQWIIDITETIKITGIQRTSLIYSVVHAMRDFNNCEVDILQKD